MNQIELIASVHLGKAGDGSIVAPYITPESIDPTLLVGIPRLLNREAYDIAEDNLPFGGCDVWNCYEVSALLDNGYPISGVLRLKYASGSHSIVESKSLKLYLNSFNMDRLGLSVVDAKRSIESVVSDDLTRLLGSYVETTFFTYEDYQTSEDPFGDWTPIEDLVDVESITFDKFKESSEILKVVETEYPCQRLLTTNALRSNCRVTNQPDWGDIFIFIEGNFEIEEESLLQYIVSMRKENHFHEEIVECVYKRLFDLMPGASIGVAALYTRRGGIDINPIRYSDSHAGSKFEIMSDISKLHHKTTRQ